MKKIALVILMLMSTAACAEKITNFRIVTDCLRAFDDVHSISKEGDLARNLQVRNWRTIEGKYVGNLLKFSTGNVIDDMTNTIRLDDKVVVFQCEKLKMHIFSKEEWILLWQQQEELFLSRMRKAEIERNERLKQLGL